MKLRASTIQVRGRRSKHLVTSSNKKFGGSLAGLLLSVLLLGFSVPASAEEVANLYSLSGLVTDTSEAQRNLAANAWLGDLLIRVSGTQQVLVHLPPTDFISTQDDYAEHPNFNRWQTLSAAHNLISQYSYTSTNELLELENGTKVPAQKLELKFDAVAVKRLLSSLQEPVWDANRPRLVIWLVLDSRNGRTLITPETNQPLSQVLLDQNKLRGLPAVFPNNQQHLNSMLNAIWLGDEERIINASRPYQADAILIGRISSAANNWRVEWDLFSGALKFESRSLATTLRQALMEGSNFAAEELSKRYASRTGQAAGNYKLAIASINNLADYAAVGSYLNGLSLVKKLRLVESSPAGILYELTLSGGLDQLRANLSLDGRLQEDIFFELPDFPAADAYFHWQLVD